VASLICSGLSSYGFVSFGLGFYELFPQFDCDLDGVWTENCSVDQICQGQTTNQTAYEINYNNHTSLHNWVEQVDLVCVPSEKIGVIGSSYFVGWVCTILVLPWLADRIGRRWIYCACMFITILSTLTMFFTKSLNVIIAMNFIAGAMNSGRLSVGFIFGNEFLTPYWQVIFGTTYNFFDGFDTMLIVMYFDWISKHYVWIASMCVVLGIISVSGSIFVLSESPLW
jgi:MFS family permease